MAVQDPVSPADSTAEASPRYKIVRTPDGRRHRFPGQTPNETIKATIDRYWQARVRELPQHHRERVAAAVRSLPRRYQPRYDGEGEAAPAYVEPARAPGRSPVGETSFAPDVLAVDRPPIPVEPPTEQQRRQVAVLRAFPEAAEPGFIGPLGEGEIPFETAEQRLQRFQELPPAARAGLRFGKGVVGALPSLSETARPRTAAIPEPTTMGERLLEGAGGAVSFMGQSMALSALGVPALGAAAIPAALTAGTTTERAVSATAMGAASAFSHLAGPMLANFLSSGRGVEASMAAVASRIEQAALSRGLSPTQAKVLSEEAARSALEGISQSKSAVAETMGKVVPPFAFGVAAPWVQSASMKQLGDENARWPTVTELTESVGLLFGVGVGAGLSGRTRAQRAMEQPRELPAREDDPLRSPEKIRAFQVIGEHLRDPGMSAEIRPQTRLVLQQRSTEATTELNRQMRGARISFQTAEGEPIVTGNFAYGRVFPYPGEPVQVRLVIQEPQSGQMVPFGFRDLGYLRRDMARARRSQAAQEAVLRPAGVPGRPGPPGPAGAQVATPESARSGYLRLTQPGLPEELLQHFALGRPLHPVAAAARERALEELSGVVRSNEIRTLARTSRDAETFRARLTDLLRERLPDALPARLRVAAEPERVVERPPDAVPEPPLATRGEVAAVPEGRLGGTAIPERRVVEPPKPEPPREPTHAELGMADIESILRDDAHRKEFERMAARGASDEELHGFLRRALGSRGIVLAEEEPAAAKPPAPEPAAETTRAGARAYQKGEKLVVPYTGRGDRIREWGIVEGYVDVKGEPHVLVRVRHGKQIETRTFTEDQVRRAPKVDRRPAVDRLPHFRELIREEAGGDVATAQAIAVRARAAFERAQEAAKAAQPQYGEPATAEQSGHYARLRDRMRRRADEAAVSRSVLRELGGRLPEPISTRTERDFMEFEEGKPTPAPESVKSIKGLAELLRARIGVPRPEVPSGEAEVPKGRVAGAPEPGPGLGPGRGGRGEPVGREPGGRPGGDRFPGVTEEYAHSVRRAANLLTDEKLRAETLRVVEQIRGTPTDDPSRGQHEARVRIYREELGSRLFVGDRIRATHEDGEAFEGVIESFSDDGVFARVKRTDGTTPGSFTVEKIERIGSSVAESPPDVPAGEWRPTLVEARAEHSRPADESVVPPEFRDKLYPHQRQGTAKMISAMIEHGGGLLASGTGAGKTRMELVAAEKMRRLGRAVLIVTPSEVIKQDWKAGTYAGDFAKSAKALGIELRLWNQKYERRVDPVVGNMVTMAVTTKISDGSVIAEYGESGRVVHVWPEKRLARVIFQDKVGVASHMGEVPFSSLADQSARQLEPGKIYITTLEQVHHIAADKNLVLILDEAHKFKNPSAKRTQKMLALIDQAASVMAASATPKDTINNLHYLVRSGILEGGTFAQMLDKIGLQLKMSNIARPVAEGELIEVGDRIRFTPRFGITYPRYPFEGNVTEVAQPGGVPTYTVEQTTRAGRSRTFTVTKDMGEFEKFDRANRIIPKPGVTDVMIERNTEALFDRMVSAGRMVRHEISLEGIPIQLVTINAPPDLVDQMARLESETTEGRGADNMPSLRKATVKGLLRRHLEHLKIDKAAEVAIAEHKRGRQVVIFAHRVNESTPNKYEKVWDGQKYVSVKVPLEEFRTPGTMKELKKRLEAAGLTVGEIHGKMTKPEQLEAMRRFQAGELDAIVATPESGGTGIDLDHQNPKARPRTLILMTAPFDAMGYTQAIGRVIRATTLSKPVVSILYVDHAIDLWNRGIIERKLSDLGATVKGEVPKLAEGQAGDVPTPRFEARMPGGGRPSARAQAPIPRGAPLGIPIPPRPRRVPTEKESIGLPETPVPPGPKKPGAAKRALESVREALREVTRFASPLTYADPKHIDVVMKGKGDIEYVLARVQDTQKKVEQYFDRRTQPQILDYVRRLQSGDQPDPRLAAMAEAHREQGDDLYRAIRRHKAVPYLENWFPQIWKKPEEARAVFTRRPIEGSKRFLRRRFHEDWLKGLEAGLEPVTWNPETMIQAARHDFAKFIMHQNARKEFKRTKALVGPTFDKPGQGDVPKDFVKYESIFLPPEIEVKEYFDKAIMEGITKVADDLGIRRVRKTGIGGRKLGFAEGAPGQPGKVTTRFATPESVLLHEIGHRIDTLYGLQAMFSGPKYAAELRALADLRAEGQSVTASHRKYLHSGPEKIAAMFQALVHAPERFKDTAPNSYKTLTTFLGTHAKLKPLLSIRPSLTFGEGTGQVSAGGQVIGGHYYMQKDLARLLNNWMSKDPIMDTKAGRGAMWSRNTITSFELGLSAFHASVMMVAAIETRFSIGISEIAHGRLISGLAKVATSPIAMPLYLRKGYSFFKGDHAMTKLEHALFHAGAKERPALAKLERELFSSGAKEREFEYNRVRPMETFIRNARRVIGAGGSRQARLAGVGRASLAAPFAAMDATMWALTRYVIPQMKRGAWADVFASELKTKEKDIAAGLVSRETVGRKAWRDVEDRMGMLNYDNEFWNRGLRSTLQLMIRAPGWRLGTARVFGGPSFVDYPRWALKVLKVMNLKLRSQAVELKDVPEFTPRMAFLLSLVSTWLLGNGIYHFLHTGKKPEERDWIWPENGLGQRVALPGYGRELPRMVRNPIKWLIGTRTDRRGVTQPFTGGALAPEFRMGWEFITNQYHRGVIRPPNSDLGQQAAGVTRWLFDSMVPFSVTSMKEMEGKPLQRVEAIFGVTPHHEPRRPVDAWWSPAVRSAVSTRDLIRRKVAEQRAQEAR